ncbi:MULTISPECIES: hypothetical protein [unclassified Paenibacillus]|uniref:hypothetical protein n=1 Tax=unclassified Paenibacillus TaxID=185978 RepID=UPI001AE375CD|nr:MULTISPECIES: hypothetical protein [unclassified Paenibacillus]MBP1154534.1 hypothetical protein [Paenibacillus sp. PvP091]MBP1170082.1 hypothetical protein [Paenibacillus sp. PvR098]MBP2441110.1 hypothetical protein [Paenibacillus sp. PvP052]
MERDNPHKRKFLFNVDIMIEDETNGRALETLLHLLNTKLIEDYQIKQGVELGKRIEVALNGSAIKKIEIPTEAKTAPALNKKNSKAEEPYHPESDPHKHIWEQMMTFQQNNTLIRLSIVKGKGIKLSMPCRIISVDPASGNLTVYHVDEKKVYLLKINEIDDYVIH